MIEFLVVIGAIWLIAAAVCDIRKREIPNWLSFSLIAVGLGYRTIFSILNWDAGFLINGLIGLAIFVGLGYVFYYARVFAGGDAKLFMALGVILPFSEFNQNLIIFLGFVLLLLIVGSIYGLIFSFFLVFMNKKKFVVEFKKQKKKYKNFFWMCFLLAGFLFLVLILFKLELLLFLFPILLLLLPLLFVYAKAIEEACMIKEVEASKLTEGDWLYENIIIGKKLIKPNWEGLSADELVLISKYGKNRKILIKQGIPFVPVFLITYIILIYLWYLKIPKGIFGTLKIF